MKYIFRSFFLMLLVILVSNCSDENNNNNNNFKTLKYNNSNMRVGPGKEFEIKWNFKKIGLPVKILNQYERWYQVETPDGSIGWMNTRLFEKNKEKNKTVIFLKNSKIFKKPNKNASIIGNIGKNNIVNIKSCKKEWCKIESKKYNLIGYTHKINIWGAIVSEPQ